MQLRGKSRSPGGACILALALIALFHLPARAENLLPNGDLHDGITGWSLFVPGDAASAGCQRSIVTKAGHAGDNCVRMESSDFARFATGPFQTVPCKPKDRFRVSSWLKNDGAVVREGSAGVVIRMLLLHEGKDVANSLSVFLRSDGKVSIQPAGQVDLTALRCDLPAEWTKVESVFEIPDLPGVDAVSAPQVFGWLTKGAFLVGGLSMEPVANDTPLGEVVGPTLQPAGTDAVHANSSGPLATDDDAIAELNLDAAGMASVKAAAESKSFPTIEQAYLDYHRTASPAKYTINASDKPIAAVEKADAIGDEIARHFIRNSYGFSPMSGDMGQPFDWKANPVPRSSPDYTFEWTYCIISRTGFWKDLANAYWKTLDEKYAQTWVDQFLDFVAKNPADDQPPTGSLWRTLDASERMYDSWPYCYAHFLNSPAFTPQANWIYLRSLLDHVKILKAGLDVPGRTGNWVVSECYGLYAIGALFPELKDAASWRQMAMDRMSRELAYCVPPDGFEAELTPNYHYFTLSSFTGPMKLAKLNQLPIPPEFHDKVLAMYRAPVLVMDQRGMVVPTNDSSVFNAASQARIGRDLVGSDPLLDWAISGGKDGIAPPASTMLPYAGFYTMRGGWKPTDTFLFFRAGPTGIAHEHEDMLEITLRAWNRSLLFEQGTYEYNQSDWRRFVLGTSSHSTIIVDGNGQHRGRSSAPVTQPAPNPWVSTPIFDFVSGTYDKGYQQSVHDVKKIGSGVSYVGPSDHSVAHTRRVVFLKPYYTLILDTLDGSGTHTFDSLYYLDSPSAEIDNSTNAAFSHNKGDIQLGLYPLEQDHLKAEIVQGQMDPILGWFADAHRTTPTVRFRKRQDAPARFATFLYPYFGSRPPFHAQPLSVGDGAWGQLVHTSLEDATVAVSLDDSPRPLTITDGDAAASSGETRATAAGLIVRRRPRGEPFLGAWKLSHFSDSHFTFDSTDPANLVWQKQADGVIICNTGNVRCDVHVAHPWQSSVTLQPNQWTLITATGAEPAPPPQLFEPIEQAFPEPKYTDYVRSATTRTSIADVIANAPAIRITADQFTLPPHAELKPRIGVDHPIVIGWKDVDARIIAQAKVPEDGWYHIKFRYCSGDHPMQSIMINNAFPFSQAHNYFLPSTLGDPPSNGYSDRTNDWNELTLGEWDTPGGWNFWLAKGNDTITFENDDGKVNLDWIELDPANQH